MATRHDGLYGIGDLARRAGVTVKTVRFYSDRGLLPETARSSGGHRRYGPEALDRLLLIRALRGLGLPLPDVRRVLADEDAAGGVRGSGRGGWTAPGLERDGETGPEPVAGGPLEDVLTGQLSALGAQLRALRWREAALRVVRDSPPAQRADRLRLVGAVPSPPTTDALARFWRGWLPPRMPARSVTAFLEAAVPHPPDEPSPAQALAFARLHALTSRPCTGDRTPQPAAHTAAGAKGAVLLYAGLAEAYDLAGARLRRDAAPRPGQELDCFVAAYAGAYGVRDTPDFRRGLARRLPHDPRIDWYWDLVSEVVTTPGRPPEPTPGSAHAWLLTALGTQMGDGVA